MRAQNRIGLQMGKPYIRCYYTNIPVIPIGILFPCYFLFSGHYKVVMAHCNLTSGHCKAVLLQKRLLQ
jgi:hypothetical protein